MKFKKHYQIKETMRVLSLFSGIGAHDLGLEWAGMEIVGQVEIDDYAREILQRHWPAVPKWGDIKYVTAKHIRELCGTVDLITGGFPCTQISNAGTKQGLDGKDSGLWREMRRLIRNVRPRWLLIENVSALRVRGGDELLSDLEEDGYDTWPLVVRAEHVQAPHRRERVFVVGYAQMQRRRGKHISAASRQSVPNADRTGEIVSDADRSRSRIFPEQRRWPVLAHEAQADWEQPRSVEPPVGRSVDGTTRRMALKALGNANPPQVLAMIGRAVMRTDDLINRS